MNPYCKAVRGNMLDNGKPFTSNRLTSAQVVRGEIYNFNALMSTANGAELEPPVVSTIPSGMYARECVDEACEKDACTETKNI
jgi:hypothetical protein